ncbi:dnaK protein [Tritrichomonas foetus]|uniref:DnaK protein n=1 Tax=Tritrichomonas foetus TaxID=1144522 RepID=A0A1J4K817_9EUKA|nr:dnaK protein [Tritrichomonas foetus]|eukprot:OHT07024.1 dnaK protein [Tritrichomonas foetus]
MVFLFVAFFTFTVKSAIFGIDYGNENIKTSMALSGKSVHVALNQNSKRLSPAYFSLWRTNNPRNTTCEGDHWEFDELGNFTWAFLDSAKSHALRFPNNTIQGLSPLLENQLGLRRREAVALTLRHLVKTIDDGKWKPENAKIVFAVEPHMSREERYSIYEMVSLMNATLTNIIEYPTAAAQLYALEKRSLYAKKAKTVVFVDIGAKNTWAAVFTFEPTKRRPTVTELSLVTSPGLGGNNIDDALTDLLLQRFTEKYSVEKPTDQKIISKFREEAKKAKDVLSISKEVEVRIEDLDDGKFLMYKITQAEYESLLSQFGQKLTRIYLEAVEQAQLKMTDIDSIELIGGSTRVPFIQSVLLNASGLKKLDRTLNSDEAIALGAGYVGASQSSMFIVKKLNLSPYCRINVSLVHGDTELKIFNETSHLNETYKYLFYAENNDNFTIKVNGKVMTQFYINLSNKTKPNAQIFLNIGFNEYTIPNVTQIKLNKFAYNMSNVIFTNPRWSLSTEEFNKSFEFILEMEKIVEDRKKHQETYNEYESYIYSIKDKLMYDETFQRVVNESDAAIFRKAADEHRKWLDENMLTADTDTLKKKHEELKEVLKDAERREEDIGKRQEYYDMLNKSLNWIYKELTETWPKKKKWMPKDKLRSAWSNYNSTKKWMDEMAEEQKTKKDWENPAAWWNQLNIQRQIMEFNFNQSCRMKKPTPTPVGWIPPEPTPDPEEEYERHEEEHKRHEEEFHHHEEFRKHMDAYRAFVDKYHSITNGMDPKKSAPYRKIFHSYSEIHDEYLDKHDEYIHKLHDSFRYGRNRSPQYYNDYYYYYEILKPTPEPSNATDTNTTTEVNTTLEANTTTLETNNTTIETNLTVKTEDLNATDLNATDLNVTEPPVKRRRGHRRRHHRPHRRPGEERRRFRRHHHRKRLPPPPPPPPGPENKEEHEKFKESLRKWQEERDAEEYYEEKPPGYRRIPPIVVPPPPELPEMPPELLSPEEMAAKAETDAKAATDADPTQTVINDSNEARNAPIETAATKPADDDAKKTNDEL